MAAKLILTGIRELDDALRALGKTEANKASRRALREVCKRHVLPAVKREAPVFSGALQASPKVRAGKRSRSRVEYAVVIGADRVPKAKAGKKYAQSWYPAVVEFGGQGRLPDPFARRAYEDCKDVARADAGRIWLQEIETAQKKLASQATP